METICFHMNSWRSAENPVTHGTQKTDKHTYTDKKHTDKVRFWLVSLRNRQQKENKSLQIVLVVCE